MSTLEEGVTCLASMSEVIVMWNWILVAVIVGGIVTLLAVAAVRQRRYAGDKPIGQQHKENTKKGSSGGGNFAGAG